jgi:hypothetical protein
MRILKAHDFKRMPWKNGGGETVEIAAYPPSSTLEAFHWRVSMSAMVKDGRFSRYPGVDRSIALLDGDTIALALDGAQKCTVSPGSAPLTFAGESAAFGCLLGRPATDFNVMTRREHYQHRLHWREWQGELALEHEAEAGLLFVVSGQIEAGPLFRLQKHEAMLLERSDPPRLTLFSEEPASAWWVEFVAAQPA